MPKSLKCTVPVLIILLACVVLGGCGSHEDPPMSTDTARSMVVGKVWKLQSLFSRDVHGDEPLTLEFKEDGSVQGFGGCNTFTGTYTLDGEQVKFGPFAATKKACPGAAGDQEYTFLTFLATIERLKVESDTLELYSDNQPEPMTLTTGSGGWLW